jgi:hypothetical protein
MISERQAEALLHECERAMGRPLSALRQRLRKQDDPLANLWELITLYCALPLGTVSHEPTEAAPDISIESVECPRLWLEASYIHPRFAKEMIDIGTFPRWILRILRTSGIAEPERFDVRMDRRDATADLQVPPSHTWNALAKHPSWTAFVEALRVTGLAPLDWICPSGNVVVTLRRKDRTPAISYPMPGLPTSVQEHVLYRKIREKAAQADKWRQQRRSHAPLVLCFGASEEIAQVNPLSPLHMPLQKAVYAALVDARKRSLAEQFNLVGTAFLSRKRLHVPGAKYIAAVIVVTLEIRPSLLDHKGNKRASVTAFLNPDAHVPLTEVQCKLLQRMDFNSIEYGPGWEAWCQSPQTRHRQNTGGSRLKRQGGNIIMREPSEIEIPAHVLARILAGDLSAAEAWSGYNEELRLWLKHIIERNQTIVDCRFVSTDPQSREEPCVLLRYGPRKMVIADPEA